MLGNLLAKLTGVKKKKPAKAPTRSHGAVRGRKAAPKKRATTKRATKTARKRPSAKKVATRRTSTTRAKPATKKRGKTTTKRGITKAASVHPEGLTAKDQVGKVIAFFRQPVVAVIKVSKPITKGARLRIAGHTTDITFAASSMQVNHKPILQARKGQEIGIKTPTRARRGDRVYRI